MREREKKQIPEPQLIHVQMGHPDITECRSVSFIHFKNEKYPDGAIAFAGSIWPEDMAHEEIYFRSKHAGNIISEEEITGGGILTFYRDIQEAGKTKFTGVISKSSHTYPGYIETDIVEFLWKDVIAKLDPEKYDFDAPFLK